MNRILLTLFLIFFALPDLGINLGPINLRVNDIIIYLLFLINLGTIQYQITYIIKLYKIQLLLILYSSISLLVVVLFSSSELISSYELIRSIGSIPFLIILPYLLKFKRNRDFFYRGAFIGGAIYIVMLYFNYQSILINAELIKNYASFKSSVAFSSINPNAVSTISVILSGANFLSYFENKSKYSLLLSVILLLVPFLIYSRAVSLSILFSMLFFILVYKKMNIKSVAYLFMFFSIIYLSISNFINLEFLSQALDINVFSGQGFSGRYEVWEQGLQLIQRSILFGHGFCTNIGLYDRYFYGHMSHNIILHYWIELGFIGVFLFFSFLHKIFRNNWNKYINTYQLVYLFQFCFFLSFAMADLSGQLLYMNKYAYLIYILSLIDINTDG